ncbi:alpha/beta fold hydrolase [Inhella crocodyli]|uniref:Alpha/beta fold hydrolase n=1 Tax=Inhella crocodyli TaxID=2499851 RepID=A0A3S3TBW8_9BURK|nr:alpha/beta fold hydrolase [Inhella crocodyli]RVT87632.1 alpha/beta fold hydrolase [Inhella crocodyli]
MPREVVLPPAEPSPARAPQAPAMWVLIGPMARGAAHWGLSPQALLTELRRVQPSARLFTMDVPGTGHCREQAIPGQVDALAAQLRQRLQAAGAWHPGQRLGLIGHSLGGLMAIEWARRAPDEIGALVLLSPAVRPFTPILRGTPWRLWSRALRQWWGGEASPEVGRAPWRSAMALGMARWRYATSRRRPAAPVLLLAGERDAWRDWRVAQRISRAWGAALRLHPKAGHDLLLDDAPWVARSIAEWLLPVGSAPLP